MRKDDGKVLRQSVIWWRITNQCEDIEIMGFTHDGRFAEYIFIPPEAVE